MSGTHARLAPSAAHRWFECPGSPDLEARIPGGGVPSIYADEGTMLHTVVSERLPYVRATRDVDFSDLIGKEIRGESRLFTFDVGHANAAQSCAEWALECGLAAPLTVAWIEQRVYIPGRDDCYGTADFGLLDRPLKVLRVTDWKFGLGVQVFARQNWQLVIYALGLLLAMDGIEEVERVQIIVHQPRLNHHDMWEISADELRGFLRRVLDAAARTDTDKTLVDGDWCLFCNAKPICPKLRSTALDLAKREFSVVESANADELARAMAAIPRVEAFVRAIEVETFKRLERGESVPGFKLGEGRRRREYSDELMAGAWALKNIPHQAAFTSPKLVTPAQLEEIGKHYKIKIPETLWSWQRGNLKVLPESDERAALTSPQYDFQVLGHDDL